MWNMKNNGHGHIFIMNAVGNISGSQQDGRHRIAGLRIGIQEM